MTCNHQECKNGNHEECKAVMRDSNGHLINTALHLVYDPECTVCIKKGQPQPSDSHVL